MSPEQLEAVSRQNFTPGQTASREDLAKTAAMLQVSGALCSQGQRDRAMAKNEHGDAMHKSVCRRFGADEGAAGDDAHAAIGGQSHLQQRQCHL